VIIEEKGRWLLAVIDNQSKTMMEKGWWLFVIEQMEDESF